MLCPVILDHPLISERYFFPRRAPPPDPFIVDCGDAKLACWRKVVDAKRPTLLHFHGNGEVVREYVPDDAEAFIACGVNPFFSEYRGYGGSTGTPQLGKMLGDVEAVVKATGVPTSQLIVFGRSVGSIFAVEVARRYPDIRGLILESGIADPFERLAMRVTPEELGVSPGAFADAIAKHLDHRAKLAKYSGRLLLMHTRHDGLVDLEHARKNHAWAASKDKELVVFEAGDHNTIMHRNWDAYWAAVKAFCR